MIINKQIFANEFVLLSKTVSEQNKFSLGYLLVCINIRDWKERFSFSFFYTLEIFILSFLLNISFSIGQIFTVDIFYRKLLQFSPESYIYNLHFSLYSYCKSYTLHILSSIFCFTLFSPMLRVMDFT